MSGNKSGEELDFDSLPSQEELDEASRRVEDRMVNVDEVISQPGDDDCGDACKI
ncbi:hypothetical protein [Escherichia phage EP_H11]|nr:hypothetical protein [Escherichia phage EP_H11]